MNTTQLRNQAVTRARQALEQAVKVPVVRKAVTRSVDELSRVLQKSEVSENEAAYGASYFGADRDPMDRMGLSGYERYDRDTSNANVAAYMLWRFFPVARTLDVGCAAGFVVEALRELGVDAQGTDISHYAIEHGAAGAQGHLQWGDLMKGLPYSDGQFELSSCLEVLEHMKPDMIDTVLAEIARVTEKYVVCTIPSFGPNQFGPGGWFQVKAKDELVEQYYAMGPDYRGPLPYDDIYRDAKGDPIEGHLTMASFEWWTEQFAKAGMERCGDVELRMHPHLARFGLSKYWNLYVFKKAGVEDPATGSRPAAEIVDVERRFGLLERTSNAEDIKAVSRALRKNGAEHYAEGVIDLVEDDGEPITPGAPHF